MTAQGTGCRISKAVWHKGIVHTFCDLCIVAIEKMFRPHTHFNKQGWEFITNEFRAKTGLSYGQKQLKNKWDALKRDYKLWKDLMRNETGLGWDTQKNTVGADDGWWEEKIKVNPSYANFRICGIEPELEQKLDVMFSTVVATGEFAISPGCNVHVTSQDQHQFVEGSGDSDEAIPLDQSLDDLFEGGDSQAGVPSNRKRTVDGRGSANPTRRLKKGKRQLGGVTMLAKHLDTLVTAVASRSSTVSSKVVESEVPTLRACVADMKTIPGLDIHGELFMFSTELLEEKMKREVYFELDSPVHKLNFLEYHFTRKGTK